MKRSLCAFASMSLTVVMAAQVRAQTGADHRRCYQMKDPLSLAATADIASKLGLDAGCKVAKAKQYCEPATVDILSAVDKKTGPIRSRPDITGPDCGRQICYKVSCPAPLTPIADTLVSDEFGTRALAGMKASTVCVPAVEGGYEATSTVTYRLEVAGSAGSPPLPVVDFHDASGLRATRGHAGHDGDFVSIDDLVLIGGTVSGSTDAWSAWYAAVQAIGDYCAAHTGTECDAAWDAADLERTATLSAIADGIVLATWHLADAWPAGLSLFPPDASGTGGGIMRLSMASDLQDFAFGSDSSIQAMFDSTVPPPAVVPATIDDDAGFDAFMARYHDPESAVLRLNGLYLATQTSPPSPPRADLKRYDYISDRFVIELDGVVVGSFKRVIGIESEVEVIEYKDGNDPITHKRAGKAKYKNIVLKRGFVNDASLLEWYKKVLAGATDRKSGSIIYLGREGNEVVRFQLTNAEPVHWSAPAQNTSSDTHIVEEIEFVVEKVERA